MRCEQCGGDFEPRRTGGHVQRFCKASCRENHWSAIRRAGALRLVKKTRASKPRRGSKENPIQAAQCPRCHLIYELAHPIESAAEAAAVCPQCNGAKAVA